MLSKTLYNSMLGQSQLRKGFETTIFCQPHRLRMKLVPAGVTKLKYYQVCNNLGGLFPEIQTKITQEVFINVEHLYSVTIFREPSITADYNPSKSPCSTPTPGSKFPKNSIPFILQIKAWFPKSSAAISPCYSPDQPKCSACSPPWLVIHRYTLKTKVIHLTTIQDMKSLHANVFFFCTSVPLHLKCTFIFCDEPLVIATSS